MKENGQVVTFCVQYHELEKMLILEHDVDLGWQPCGICCILSNDLKISMLVLMLVLASCYA